MGQQSEYTYICMIVERRSENDESRLTVKVFSFLHFQSEKIYFQFRDMTYERVLFDQKM